MALIEYTDEELAQMGRSSYAPDKEEFDRSSLGAITQSFNGIANLVDRGLVNRQPLDLTDFKNTEFTREAYQKALSEKYSPDVVLKSMELPASNWEQGMRNARRMDSVEQRDRQLSTLPSAVVLPVGFIAGAADFDVVTGLPVFKAAKAIERAYDLGKAGKVAVYTGAGGLSSGASMASYNATEGYTPEGSVLDATLFGLGITGALSPFFVKAAGAKGLNKHIDEVTGSEVTEAEALVIKQTEARKEFENISGVIEEVKSWKENKAATKEEIRQSRAGDVKESQINAPIVETKTEKAFKYAEKIYNDAKGLVVKAKDAVKSHTDEIKTLTKNLTRWEAETTQYTADKVALDALVRERTPLLGNVTKLNKQVETLTAQIDRLEKKLARSKRPDTIKAVKAEIAALKKERKPIDSKLGKAKTALSRKETEVRNAKTKTEKYDQNIPSYVKQGTKRWKELQRQLPELENGFQKTLAQEADAKAKYKEADSTLKTSKKHAEILAGTDYGQKRRIVDDSPQTRKLMDKLAQYNADLSPAGIKKLLQERGLLTEDMAKLDEGNFDVKKLYGIRTEKRNALEKLDQELRIIDGEADFRNTGAWKQASKWAEISAISPIEVNLKSENQWVRGLARLLHPGTLHHGVANTNTAWNIAKYLGDRVARTFMGMRYNYKNAVKEGFTGTEDEFQRMVSISGFRVISQMKRVAYEAIDGTIKGAEREKIARQQLFTAPRVHVSGNKWIDRSVDDLLDYYEWIDKYGKKVGLAGFGDTVGKGYMKRLYSANAINAMGRDVAIARLVEAQETFALATGRELTPEISKGFLQKAENAIDGTLNMTHRQRETVEALGVDKGGKIASSLKERHIEVFEDEIADLLETDLIDTVRIYALHTHGRIALKEKLGVNNGDELEGLLSDLRSKGATANEVDNARAMMHTILGTREMSRNIFDPTTRALKMASTYSSIMHMLGFGVNTVTEIASISKEFGWSKTMSKLSDSPQEIIRAYTYGTPSEKNTIELTISYGEALFHGRTNRMDIEDTLGSVGASQEFLDGVVRKFSIWSGLVPITDMLRMTTAALSVDFMAGLSVAKKISDTDIKRLGDMGFSVDDLPEIRRVLDVQPDGRIANTKRETWGALDKKITFGVQTMVERTILHPNGITLPKFMTNMNEGQFVSRLLMKFMRFPVESWERMFVRGMQEADAKQLMALVGNVAMWGTILAMKDAVKDPIDRKYNGKDGLDRLMMESLIMNTYTQYPVLLADQVSSAFTGKNLSNDYRSRFGGVVVSDVSKLLSGTPSLSTPFGSAKLNIGDGVASAGSTINHIEDFWKND